MRILDKCITKIALVFCLVMSESAFSACSANSYGCSLDLNSYCANTYGSSSYAQLTGSTAYDWSCKSGASSYSMDLASACRSQYNDSSATVAYGDFYDPYSWYCSLSTSSSSSSSTSYESLFDWLEVNYSSYLSPSGMTTRTSAPYTYRYYPDTQSYVAISADDSSLYYLGPASGNRITNLGAVATWLNNAGSSTDSSGSSSDSATTNYYDPEFCAGGWAGVDGASCEYDWANSMLNCTPGAFDYDYGRTLAYKWAACYSAAVSEYTDTDGRRYIEATGGTNCYSSTWSFGPGVDIYYDTTTPHWSATTGTCGVQ